MEMIYRNCLWKWSKGETKVTSHQVKINIDTSQPQSHQVHVQEFSQGSTQPAMDTGAGQGAGGRDRSCLLLSGEDGSGCSGGTSKVRNPIYL